MTTEKSKKRITAIIWVLCGLILIGVFGIPKMYQNYHSAPYYNVSGRTVILENSQTNTHKLNKYQKGQFIKIAKKTIDSQDGPFKWNNYKVISLDIYKIAKKSEYALVLKVKPKIKVKNSTVTNSMIIKLHHRNLINYYDVSVQKYSSGFSNIFNIKGK
ncbi:hypothetical protein [Companilactobacillus kimchiensis]|uniref:Uncharacterized protein n=1 Tax=Companilactobacillus kimchiensis TaxID=993692 RepID=A0A0R2LH43_9LACO|nr:hypothetical protein [Companilactobacillus kimchiensis]KRO00759.1 hypothetical protein IV57_GL000079 [Companilactobacillus kimchiensis]